LTLIRVVKLMQNKIVYLEKRKAHLNQRIKELQYAFGI
jgi:hypothetical protein